MGQQTKHIKSMSFYYFLEKNKTCQTINLPSHRTIKYLKLKIIAMKNPKHNYNTSVFFLVPVWQAAVWLHLRDWRSGLCGHVLPAEHDEPDRRVGGLHHQRAGLLSAANGHPLILSGPPIPEVSTVKALITSLQVPPLYNVQNQYNLLNITFTRYTG